MDNSWRIYSKGMCGIHLQALKFSSLYLIKTRIKCQQYSFSGKGWFNFEGSKELQNMSKPFWMLSGHCWIALIPCLACTECKLHYFHFYSKWLTQLKKCTLKETLKCIEANCTSLNEAPFFFSGWISLLAYRNQVLLGYTKKAGQDSSDIRCVSPCFTLWM